MGETKRPVLQSEKRKVFGRKVKKLRAEGILPGNVFGKNIKSIAVQVPAKDFENLYLQVKETGLLDLKITGEDKLRPVLIHNLQVDPVTDQHLHVDFYQVDLKEKITAKIPVEMVGESPAVSQKLGILIQPLGEVEVEALPEALPEKFSIDVSNLKAVGEMISVADLKAPVGVKIVTGGDQLLAKIEPLAKEEVTPPPTTESVPPAGEEPSEVTPAEEKQGETKTQPVEGIPTEEKQ